VHRAVHEGGGYAGLAVYYIAWLAVMVTLAVRITYAPYKTDHGEHDNEHER
jgi:hypothetical protein